MCALVPDGLNTDVVQLSQVEGDLEKRDWVLLDTEPGRKMYYQLGINILIMRNKMMEYYFLRLSKCSNGLRR